MHSGILKIQSIFNFTLVCDMYIDTVLETQIPLIPPIQPAIGNIQPHFWTSSWTQVKYATIAFLSWQFIKMNENIINSTEHFMLSILKIAFQLVA